MNNYSEKLKDPRWQRKRLEIMNRDNFTCQYCKDKETSLQVHHLAYKNNPWDVDDKHLVTLCSECHTFVEHCKKYKIEMHFPYIKRKQLNGAYPIFMMPYTVESVMKVSIFRGHENGFFKQWDAFNRDFLEAALSLIPKDNQKTGGVS